MKEKEIEQYLIRRVREVGGIQRKWVSPGHRGVPDRIVVFDGRVSFVELKAPGKFLRPDQQREHIKLRKMKCRLYVIDSKEGVEYFIGKEA
jgi:hypothetical protein